MKLALRFNAGRLFSGKKTLSPAALKKWNFTYAVLLAAQGAALLLFSTVHEVPVNVLFLTSDSLQTSLAHQAVTAPAMRQLTSVNLSYIMAAALFASAVLYALQATLYWRRYQNAVKKGVHMLRWVGYMVSGGMVILVVALAAGVYDLASLLMVVTLVAVMYLSGWVIELYSAGGKHTLPLHAASAATGIAAGAIAWITVLGYLIGNVAFGGLHLPVYTWVLVIAVIVLTKAQVVLVHLAHRSRLGRDRQARIEGRYMGLDFIMKTLAAWLLFAALLHP